MPAKVAHTTFLRDRLKRLHVCALRELRPHKHARFGNGHAHQRSEVFSERGDHRVSLVPHPVVQVANAGVHVIFHELGNNEAGKVVVADILLVRRHAFNKTLVSRHPSHAYAG